MRLDDAALVFAEGRGLCEASIGRLGVSNIIYGGPAGLCYSHLPSRQDPKGLQLNPPMGSSILVGERRTVRATRSQDR